jgi:hypothetical protein
MTTRPPEDKAKTKTEKWLQLLYVLLLISPAYLAAQVPWLGYLLGLGSIGVAVAAYRSEAWRGKAARWTDRITRGRLAPTPTMIILAVLLFIGALSAPPSARLTAAVPTPAPKSMPPAAPAPAPRPISAAVVKAPEPNQPPNKQETDEDIAIRSNRDNVDFGLGVPAGEEEALRKMEDLLAKGRSMTPLRSEGSASYDMSACGDKMRANQKKIPAIRKRLEAMPLAAAGVYTARVALVDLTSCVSCLPTGSKSCTAVERLLNESRDEIALVQGKPIPVHPQTPTPMPVNARIEAEASNGPGHRPETLKGGYMACISEELFDQISLAGAKRDFESIRYLLDNGCLVTKTGLKISVLERGFTTAKIRVISGKNAVVLWTATENIVR